MTVFDELIGKSLGNLSKALGSSSNTTLLTKYGVQDQLSIERYYDIWKGKIESSSKSNRILSNGWAFASLSGVSSFEHFVRTNPDFHKMYFNQAGEIKTTLEKIGEKMSWSKFGGVMIYGYGNLLRERYFIEQAILSGLIAKSCPIRLIDCSIYYHILANSPLNQLLPLIRRKRIKAVLADFIEDSDSIETLIFERDDLHGIKPILHLFLGNTFGNSEERVIRSLVQKLLKPGDVVICEYAAYTEDYLNSQANDYVSEMARMAASELYSLPVTSVEVKNTTQEAQLKYCEIRIHRSSQESPIEFKSMLRRNFKNMELLNGAFSVISSNKIVENSVFLDAFIRLSEA